MGLELTRLGGFHRSVYLPCTGNLNALHPFFFLTSILGSLTPAYKASTVSGHWLSHRVSSCGDLFVEG